MTKLHLKPVHFYILFACLYVGFIFWQPDSGYDKYFWMDWARDIAWNGLGSIYLNPEVNYHPFILYLLKIYTWIDFGNIPEEAINGFKSIVILFDFATLALVVWLLDRWRKNLLWVLVLLLNPAFWYNTVVWGQTDTIYTFFAFASLVAVLNRQAGLGVILFLLAVNTKMQAIIFLPLLVLLIVKEQQKVDWFRMGIILVGIQLLVFLPFILAGNIVPSIKAITVASIDQYPVLSRNAFNLWYLMFDNPFYMPDGGLKYLGLGNFILFYSLIVWQLITQFKNNLGIKDKYRLVMLSASLVTIIFFYFNTQMHERYVHSSILFLGVFGVLSGRWWVYALASLAYLANLESVMNFAKYYITSLTDNYTFNPMLVSMLFLLAIITCFVYLFRFTPNNK